MRVRPKVMTVGCMFMGLFPILWSSGTGRRRDEAHRRTDDRWHLNFLHFRIAGLPSNLRRMEMEL